MLSTSYGKFFKTPDPGPVSANFVVVVIEITLRKVLKSLIKTITISVIISCGLDHSNSITCHWRNPLVGLHLIVITTTQSWLKLDPVNVYIFCLKL